MAPTDGYFAMNLWEKHIWIQRSNSWLYVDMLGIVRGRVDKVDGAVNAPWYWWQTARTTDCERDLNLAKRFVEHTIGKR